MERIASSQKNLGRNVARLRRGSALTQEKLSELARIDIRYIQKIEAGRTNPSLEMLARLRAALAASWNDLLEGAG